ncbi:hypothetical protein D3C87_1617320 [compost metagenome]
MDLAVWFSCGRFRGVSAHQGVGCVLQCFADDSVHTVLPVAPVSVFHSYPFFGHEVVVACRSARIVCPRIDLPLRRCRSGDRRVDDGSPDRCIRGDRDRSAVKRSTTDRSVRHGSHVGMCGAVAAAGRAHRRRHRA